MAKWALPDDNGLKDVLDAMLRLDVSSAEVVRAIEQYANEREFERDLKRYYESIIDDSWDYWHEGNI
jgi:hypothetical protein